MAVVAKRKSNTSLQQVNPPQPLSRPAVTRNSVGSKCALYLQHINLGYGGGVPDRVRPATSSAGSNWQIDRTPLSSTGKAPSSCNQNTGDGFTIAPWQVVKQ